MLNLPRLQAYADCNLMMDRVEKKKNQPFRLEILENEQSIQFIEVLLMFIGCCSRKKFFAVARRMVRPRRISVARCSLPRRE